MGFLVTGGLRSRITPIAMHNSFFQRLILVILAGAIAAGLFEFYKEFVVGSMEAVNGGYNTTHVNATPRPTPRRF